jgi:bacteriorhodopsin
MDAMTTSFYTTYVFLITTGTITFIEALRTKDATIRHVMNLETCISIIAAFFYSQFLERIKEAEKREQQLPFADINVLRYTDWFISTPFMLFVLCMVLANEAKIPFRFSVFALVMMLDYAMLGIGYIGEIGRMDRKAACFIGFVAFVAMFGFIWYTLMTGKGKSSFAAMLSFVVFVSVWSMYGIVYMLDEKTKNIAYNILDLIAKALMGIFFWMYFTHAVVF